MLRREEGSTRCARKPGYGGGIGLVLASLPSRCRVHGFSESQRPASAFCLSPSPPGPGKVLLEEPVTAISTPPDMCLSMLPLAGTMPRMTHLWTAWPSQNGLLVLCRVALCFQRGGFSYAPGSGTRQGTRSCCPYAHRQARGQRVLRSTWNYVHGHSGTISPEFTPGPHVNTLIHKHKERHKQRYTSPESQTHPEIYKHTPVTQTHRDSPRTPPPPHSHPVSRETHSQECPEWGQAGLGLVPCSRDETRKASAPGSPGEGEC